MLDSSQSQHYTFLPAAKQLTAELDAVEKRIVVLYNHRMTTSELNMLVFFLAEVRNDIFAADNYARHMLPFDQALLK